MDLDKSGLERKQNENVFPGFLKSNSFHPLLRDMNLPCHEYSARLLNYFWLLPNV